ncbi:MAG: hypothetical protein ACRYFX_18645 [Janthinobacterium lividum]
MTPIEKKAIATAYDALEKAPIYSLTNAVDKALQGHNVSKEAKSAAYDAAEAVLSEIRKGISEAKDWLKLLGEIK